MHKNYLNKIFYILIIHDHLKDYANFKTRREGIIFSIFEPLHYYMFILRKFNFDTCGNINISLFWNILKF